MKSFQTANTNKKLCFFFIDISNFAEFHASGLNAKHLYFSVFCVGLTEAVDRSQTELLTFWRRRRTGDQRAALLLRLLVQLRSHVFASSGHSKCRRCSKRPCFCTALELKAFVSNKCFSVSLADNVVHSRTLMRGRTFNLSSRVWTKGAEAIF